MAKEHVFKDLALTEIRINPVALRDLKEKDPKYQELIASIMTHGVKEPIQVHKKVDVLRDEEGQSILMDGKEQKDEYYEITNGLHRFSACGEIGLETIPCYITTSEQSATDVLTHQLVTNLVKVETKPTEYTRQLKRLLLENPAWTVEDLSTLCGVSVDFINKRLSLSKIVNPEIIKQVDNNVICATNAVALATLPEDAQVEMLEDAMREPAQAFAGLVKRKKQEIAATLKAGKEVDPGFQGCIPRGRKLSILKDMIESGDVASIMDAIPANTIEEAVLGTIKWYLQVDPISEEAGLKLFEEKKLVAADKKRLREEANQAKDLVKKEKKAKEANEAAEAAKLALA